MGAICVTITDLFFCQLRQVGELGKAENRTYYYSKLIFPAFTFVASVELKTDIMELSKIGALDW